MDKNKKKQKNPHLPEGGMDWELVGKVGRVYVERLAAENGTEEMAPSIIPFSEAKLYESIGQLKNAVVAYKKILGREPGNLIVREALDRVECALN